MILYNNFEGFSAVPWVACDTETFTYIDGKKVSEVYLKTLGKEKPVQWFREHTTVRVWAWQISDGKSFFVSNDFDEFIAFFGEHKTKYAWFYNAKFDFAQIDYCLLTHNPLYVERDEKTKCNTPYSFTSLHSDKGGRFSLKIWTPYKGHGKKADRHTHTHAVTFYDFCNIFGGGLKSLLKDFDVEDFDGKKIRKTTMDYQGVDEYHLTASDMEYIENDTKGLFHLIRIASDVLENLTGYSLTKGKPDIMTAGGLAKKVLLTTLYPSAKDSKNALKKFQYEHPLTATQDKYLRKYKLYNGGVCILNKRYEGKTLKNTKMKRYDVNSEYPYIMSTMPDIYGDGFKMSAIKWVRQSDEYKKTHICIYVLDEVDAYLKPNMVACWRNPYTGKFEEHFHTEDRILIFEKEFDELQKWYDIDCILKTVVVYKCRKNENYKKFVDKWYELKATSKKEGKKAVTLFTKILLNSSYGKEAERICREVTKREINPETGAVRLVHTGQDEEDTAGQMSVVQGAFITASARVWILSHVREICSNVSKDLIYIDTDSMHALVDDYDKADAFRLGAFKDEGTFNTVKYIAPKCYFDANTEGDTVKEIEFHTKGVSLKVINAEFEDADGGFKPFSYIDSRFTYGAKFQPLAGLNIRGGKALIPIEKYLAKPVAGMVETHGNLLIEE